MGIAFTFIERMDELGLFGHGRGAVLDIGSSNLYAAEAAAIARFLDRYAPGTADRDTFSERLAAGSRYDPVRGGLNESFVGELFEKAGMEYVSFDIAAGYRTTVLDLNQAALPSEFRGRFDLVLNFGTTEHILNQYNCFKVIHEATKIGGYIYHALPAVGYVDHGYVTYTGRCFFDIAGYNEYEVVDFWFEGPAGHNDLYASVRSYRSYFPALEKTLSEIGRTERATALSELNLPDVGINIIYRKVKDKAFWGALEASTSVGVISQQVIDHYRGRETEHAENVPVQASEPHVPKEAAQTFAQRISRVLELFPVAKRLARKVHRSTMAPNPLSVATMPDAPSAATAAQTAIPEHDSFDSLERTVARFSTRRLVGLEAADDIGREFGGSFQDATLILSSEAFPKLPAPRQIATITAIYNTVMSGILRESVTLADIIAWHYVRLLRSPELTEPMACQMYDCLYGLYFAGAQTLSDMRKFDSACVMPFETWLKRKLGPQPASFLPGGDERNICYFLHCAHFERGNAVSPIIASLARAHAERPNRKIFLYAVQWVLDDFRHAFDDSNVTVRTFRQDARFDRIEEIAGQMRADRIGITISDLNAAVGASLFTRRVAPLQMWTVMGFPYWALSELDWTLLIGMDYQRGFGIRRDRFSHLRVRQEAFTLSQECNEVELRKARALLPQDAFVFAIFSRLIKVSGQLLNATARILASEPRAHLLLVGTGDPRTIHEFLEDPALTGRVTFLHRNVDLNTYGRLVDVMLDTFPFHGGNAFREVAVHGKPVLAVLSPDWERLLRDERDPLLLAHDPDEFVAIALRLATDRAFYEARSADAGRLARRVTEMGAMVDDVESAIAQASSCRAGVTVER